MPFGERTVGYVALQKQQVSFILRSATTRTTTTTNSTTHTHEQPLLETLLGIPYLQFTQGFSSPPPLPSHPSPHSGHYLSIGSSSHY
ncbi:hypothetical protein PROFUN_14710 [Planoprotostelium fungivorum]|uniref:Uncharacterized protein n=1 Tax=Planoprotostelium fungivorum TaxID=1890364 RepID=A0A2P6MZ68_9EUKA|nr:hypothetical protein PROFUN_14710 [Planoprotostelium fungivorum]